MAQARHKTGLKVQIILVSLGDPELNMDYTSDYYVNMGLVA
jgi:hypothetical protein